MDKKSRFMLMDVFVVKGGYKRYIGVDFHYVYIFVFFVAT